jgi:hypothetical protein
MSYFSDASLVFIPSAQKSGKAYSIKPTDGTGDLTFTRSNDTATRVNSAGLIEKVRTNLALYSQNFSQTGTWVTSTTTRVDSQTDPNGGTTASKFTATGANSNVIQTRTVSSGIPYTWSFYAKSDSATDVNIRLDNNNGNFVQANMALTTSWQRFSITLNSNATTILCFLGGGVSFTAGEVAYMAFAQLEASDIVTDYIATTSAAVSVGPVANVPRLDYLGSSCPRLLLEPQRTNLITFSEQLDNAAWNKLGITVAANNTTSPSGYIDADKLIADAGTGNRVVYQGVVPVGVSTTTVYAKAGEFGGVVIASGTQGGFFNLTTGEYRAEYNSAPTAYNITSASNGWYRCSVTMTSVSGDNLYIGPNDNVSTLLSITGDGTSGIYAWGAQTELGAYPTSYVNTLGAAVTRGADAASKTGISSLIGQTEGTLFVDMEFEGYDNLPKWIAFLGSGSSYIGLYTTTASRFFAEVANSGVQFSSATFVFAVGQRYKLALAYKENDFAFYVNGTQVATDNNGTVPATSQFAFEYSTTANNLTARNYNQALLFKTRLSNSSLAELTA